MEAAKGLAEREDLQARIDAEIRRNSELAQSIATHISDAVARLKDLEALRFRTEEILRR
jgi:hypothetical protein